MAKTVKVIVLRTAGTNCDRETASAFSAFKAKVDLVHIQQLISRQKKLSDYHILAIPGGFSYGDDIMSGKILANELRLKLEEDLRRFISDGKLIIGICNGFQILVRAGLLPFSNGRLKQSVSLTHNDSGKFEDRWVNLKVNPQSVWTKNLSEIIYLPVAHGEGKFVVPDEGVLKDLKENQQIVFQYISSDDKKDTYPSNPNGSLEGIAGITDVTGRVLGLMPHPERHFLFEHHPRWTRLKKKTKYGDGAKIFENGVAFARAHLAGR